MHFEIAPDGCGYECKNDVIQGGPTGALYGFNLLQRKFSPGEFLRPPVRNVEAQARGGCAVFRKQPAEVIGVELRAIRPQATCHGRNTDVAVKDSLDQIRIRIYEAGGQRGNDVGCFRDRDVKLSPDKTGHLWGRVEKHVHDPNPGNAIGEAVVQAKNEPTAVPFQPMYEGQVP